MHRSNRAFAATWPALGLLLTLTTAESGAGPPLGLPGVPIPVDNPQTPEEIALGEHDYYLDLGEYWESQLGPQYFKLTVPMNRADPFVERDATGWQFIDLHSGNVDLHYVLPDNTNRVVAFNAQAGRGRWTSDQLGTNRLACAQCHPNAANTHPETYPKFQNQLGRVVPMGEMVNWCLRNPLEGEAMNPADPRMIALMAYIRHERRGVPLAPGKH